MELMYNEQSNAVYETEVVGGTSFHTAIAWDVDERFGYLIAAAPDLLEALEVLVRAVEKDNLDLDWPTRHAYYNLSKARAAIAKAKGQTK